MNANGTYDGVSIVEGHEYMETITDMRPRDRLDRHRRPENGDKCAWISSGQGAMANLTLSTGTFAVQSTWSNTSTTATAAACCTPDNRSAVVGGGSVAAHDLLRVLLPLGMIFIVGHVLARVFGPERNR